MFEVRRELPKPAQLDTIYQKWGEDRREADAFIMTQLSHNEKRLEDIAGSVVFFAIAYFAYHEGYKYAAFGIVFIIALWLLNSSMQITRRHARVHKLMDRNWDHDAV